VVKSRSPKIGGVPDGSLSDEHIANWSEEPCAMGSQRRKAVFHRGRMAKMDSLETELQKIYDSEIHVDIGWRWESGIDVSIGHGDAVIGNVKTVAEILPWLQEAIAKRFPDSRYNVERMEAIMTVRRHQTRNRS
jgi:hypothetical protein